MKGRGWAHNGVAKSQTWLSGWTTATEKSHKNSQHLSGYYDASPGCSFVHPFVTVAISHSSLHRGTIIIPILQMREQRLRYVNWYTDRVMWTLAAWFPEPLLLNIILFLPKRCWLSTTFVIDIWTWRLKFTLVIHIWADFHWHELGGHWSVQAGLNASPQKCCQGASCPGVNVGWDGLCVPIHLKLDKSPVSIIVPPAAHIFQMGEKNWVVINKTTAANFTIWWMTEIFPTHLSSVLRE